MIPRTLDRSKCCTPGGQPHLIRQNVIRDHDAIPSWAPDLRRVGAGAMKSPQLLAKEVKFNEELGCGKCGIGTVR